MLMKNVPTKYRHGTINHYFKNFTTLYTSNENSIIIY